MSAMSYCNWFRWTPFSPAVAGRATVLLLALTLFAACASEPIERPEEKPDDPLTGELQSDFLELGKQAGIEWLSFYPRDSEEFPEFYTGLDDGQKRRLRVAPREGGPRALIQFELPAGARIRPVDWFGTECVAIDLRDAKGYSAALAVPVKLGSTNASLLARERAKALGGDAESTALSDGSGMVVYKDRKEYAVYGTFKPAKPGGMEVVFEVVNLDSKGKLLPLDEDHKRGWPKVVNSAKVVRDLSIEGSPKHACLSTPEELAKGALRFDDDTLQLPLKEGLKARKLGSGSTVAIDGAGASPLLLIRRLEETRAEGDLRVRINNAPTVQAWLAPSSARFTAAVKVEEATLPALWFDYQATGREHQAFAVFTSGKRVYSIEIGLAGLSDVDKRRAAREAAVEFVRRIGYPEQARRIDASALDKLVGWAPGR